MQMAALHNERWRVQQQQDGISRKWDDRGVTTDHERELYERARSAASEAEREGDAQLQAAVAAARVLNQPAVAPTQLKFWTLKFHCDRLESAYHRKSSNNSQFYDYIPVCLKTILCVPHLLLVLAWLPNPLHLFLKRRGLSSTQQEFNLHDLWSVCAILPCVTILGIQLIWPRWYRSNRGTTLQRLVIFLWAWESLKVPLNANETNYILMEVAFLNVFMSGLHRVPFSLHCQLRSYGSALQAVAILCKGVDITTRLQILGSAFIGHLVGLGLAYFLDLFARKQFLASLPAWLLDDLAGHPTQVQGYLSYRASLSRQLWSIFYPELLGSPQPSDKSASNNQVAPRRALGGFAGGFGGVSSLKCTKPISSKISPPSSSSSMGGGSSDSSSDSWSGVGQSCFGIPRGETLPTAQNFSGILTREPVQWDVAAASSASSQVGLKHSQFPRAQSRGPTRGGKSGGYY